MKNVIFVFCAIGWLATYTAPKPACYCAIPEVKQAYEQAAAVFAGEVVEITSPRTFDENRPLADRLYIIKFKVNKSWKGSFPSLEVPVFSGQGNGCLSYPVVQVGKKYLVFADPVLIDGVPEKGQMVMTACNRTSLIPELLNQTPRPPKNQEFNREDASQDLKALDRLTVSGVSGRVTDHHRNQAEPKLSP
jgi:hypothetical protein